MSCSFRCAFLWLFGHSNFAQTVTSVLHWHFLENIDGSFYIQRAACASLGVGKPNFPAYQAWMDFAPPTTNVPKADSERTRFVFTATSWSWMPKSFTVPGRCGGRAAEWQELENERGCCKQSQPKNDFELFTVYTRHCHSSKLERDVVQ